MKIQEPETTTEKYKSSLELQLDQRLQGTSLLQRHVKELSAISDEAKKVSHLLKTQDGQERTKELSPFFDTF